MELDAFSALSMIHRTEYREEIPAFPLPPAATAAPDMASLLGLVKHGSPVPPENRDTQRRLAFEDPAIRPVVLEQLRRGYPLKVVLQAVGVSPKVWLVWRRRGEDGREPYATFLHEVTVARAQGAIGLLDQVRAAGEGAPDKDGIWKNQWQASKWLLERQDPDEFMPVDRSITAHVDLPAPQAQVDVRKMSTQDLLQLEALLERAPVIDVEAEEA
mgnify:CR=1 FL=1